MLEHDGDRYHFHYIRRAQYLEDFRPFIGFPDLGRAYTSAHLFPIFAERVMDARRPDYPHYVDILHLPETAYPWEQLARSEGRRTGDTIQVFPEPVVRPDGSSTGCFLVHGIRHRLAQDAAVERALRHLRPGNLLALQDEPANPVNPRAVDIADGAGTVLGWVPDLLLDFVHDMRSRAPVSVSVEHVNERHAPSHLRLLVRLDGRTDPAVAPFSGPDWEPIH